MKGLWEQKFRPLGTCGFGRLKTEYFILDPDIYRSSLSATLLAAIGGVRATIRVILLRIRERLVIVIGIRNKYRMASHGA